MWLYIVCVVFCLAKDADFADRYTLPPGSPTLFNRNSDSPSPSLPPVDEDVYYPNPDFWSETFDWQLLKAFDSPQYKNVLISPISLKIALAILYEGSAGKTKNEFQKVLQFNENETIVREKFANIIHSLVEPKKEYELNLGTRLFLDGAVEPLQKFSSIAKTSYRTDVVSTNFTDQIGSCNDINHWVDAITKGRIKEIVHPDDIQDIVLIVANAIYFKGYWRHQFPKNRTAAGGFYVTPRDVVTVEYMSNTDKYYFCESKDLEAKILRLPYKGRHFSMFIVLPNSKGGLPELLRNINHVNFKRQLDLLDPLTVEVRIPKFKFDFAARYSKILKNFGLEQMFQTTASFPGIARNMGAGDKRLLVSDIKQKAGLELNEEGSTIYAATDIQLGNKFGEADSVFNATHPFLFFVEDELTGSILFIGKVENPLQSEALPVVPLVDDNKYNGYSPEQSQVAEAAIHKQPDRVEKEPQQPVPLASGQGSDYLNLNPQRPEAPSSPQRFNYFDLELLSTFDDNENHFISPASIKAVLGMLYEGAGGRSAEEISKTLRVDPQNARQRLSGAYRELSSTPGATVVETANAAFVSNQYQINPNYANVIRNYYKGDISSLDFGNSAYATNLINRWANNVTHGLIPEIISPEYFSSDASIILTNALYFRGFWKDEFEEKSTSVKCFHTPRGCRNVHMMQLESNFNYKKINEIDAEVLELPYSDDKYAMVIILPSQKQSVNGLIRDLQHTTFPSIIRQLEPNQVQVNLPKFEIEYSTDLVAALKKMGIEEIFGPRANLTNIVLRGSTKVSNIIHKTKIIVNEKGSEAGAITGSIVIPLMGSSNPIFIVDRPFLFFIYHIDSKNILFEGRVNYPTEAQQSQNTNYNRPQAQQPQYVPNQQQGRANQRGNVQGLASRIAAPQPKPVYRDEQSGVVYQQPQQTKSLPATYYPADTKPVYPTYQAPQYERQVNY